MKRPAVFFDRDNTLIACDGYLGDPDKVELIAGAADAVARVRALGYATVIFSNQSGVARGLFDEDAVHAVNARLDEMLLAANPHAVIDRHEFCPFHPRGTVEEYRRESQLRKPNPGMIYSAEEKMALDLSRSWVVGDAPRDVQAGHAAGCRAILFRDANLPPSAAASEALPTAPEYICGTLAEAVDFIESHADPDPNAVHPAVRPPRPELLVEDETTAAPTPHDEAETNTTSFAPAASASLAAAEIRLRELRPFASRVIESTVADEPAIEQSVNGPRVIDARVIGSRTMEVAALELPHAEPPVPPADPAPVAQPAPVAPVPPVAHASLPPAAPIGNTARLESLVEQLLHDRRRDKEQHPHDFSVTKLLAGIIQVLVVAILFYAFIRTNTPQQQPLLLWALTLQVMTIAMLIMGQQR